MSALPPIPQMQQQAPDVAPPDIQAQSTQQPLDPAIAQQVIDNPQLQNIIQSGMPSASGVFNQQHDQQAAQGDRVKQMLSNYLEVLSKNVAELNRPQGAGERFRTGFGEGMMHNAGVMTNTQRHQLAVSNAGDAVKAILDMQQGNQRQQQIDNSQQMVQMQRPDGTIVSLPQSLMGKLGGAFIRGDVSTANNAANNSTKKLLAGYNEDGSVKPLTSLSIPQQLKAQATDALNRLNKARTDALNADPNTGAGQLALSKLQISEQMARASLTRAAAQSGMENIAAQKFAKDYIDGMQDENGNPMGLKQASLNLPTADRQRRGDLAANAQHNLDQIKTIVERRPDIFGKIGGSVAHLDDLLGSNDPDIRAIAVLGDQYALPSVGAHGLRAKGAVQQVKDDLLRSMRGGPQGFKGAYDAASSSFGSLINDQQLGKRARPTVPSGSGAPSGGVITLTDGGKSYKIPAALKASFLKDHPNAR